VESIPVYQQKHFYLNVPFFVVRSVIYFAIWMGLAWFLNKWSAQQDEPGNASAEKNLEGISGPGLVLWGIAVTFSAVDLVMSLEPKWFSSIYGMMIMVVYALSAMAFVIFIARKLTDREPLMQLASPQRFKDLGNFLLTFVMLWAYLSFSQFLIIWSGNMPEEISWYMARARGSWGALAVVLIIFHFAIPFALLLSRDIKRGPRALSAVAAALVALTLVDIFWLIVPAFEPDGLRVHWSNIGMVAGLGGLWLWAFFVQLEKRPLVPAYDSRLAEVLEDHEHVHQI
jgi:magnesium-transporting ATPase (P-type)